MKLRLRQLLQVDLHVAVEEVKKPELEQQSLLPISYSR